MSKQFKFEQDVREKMLKGVDTIANAVGKTLGPRGKLVLLTQNGDLRSTKDGITVAKNSLPLADEFENMAAKLVVESSQKLLDVCGDGTTTVTLLIQRLVSEGLRLVAAGHNSIAIKNGIEWASNKVIEELQTMSRPIKDKKEIESVATISSNGESDIGKLLSDAIERVGNDGVITLAEGKTLKTEIDVVPGFRIDRGYVSAHFANNEKLESVLKDPLVLIYDKQLNNVNIILPILKKCHEAYPGRPLFICAESIDGEALATLLVNHLKGAFASVAVKHPGFGDRRRDLLNDMAILTGATVISEDVGLKIDNFDTKWLGTAKKIVVTKNNTTIIDGNGKKEDIKKRVEEIRNTIKSATDDYDKEKSEERLAKLVGGVCVIEVGGQTESEMRERKDRLEDSLAAVRCSVESGIVPGGGVSLLRSATILDRIDIPEDFKIGCKIIRMAAEEPLKRIVQNGGGDPTLVRLKVLESNNPNFGYNARTEKFEDLLESGVIDPLKVVKTTLESAVSIVGIILTTECMIAENKEEKDQEV